MTGPGYDALRDLLARECALLVKVLRRQSARDWNRRCPPFADRAAAAAHVAQVLADAAQALEADGRPHILPPLPPHALADAVTVCGDDLLAALGRSADPQIVAGALAEVLLHRRDLDGAAPGPVASVAVLNALGAAYGESPQQAVLALAAARCPAAHDPGGDERGARGSPGRLS